MFLLNLGLGEFIALLGAASALVVTLYLLNRARRRQTVATLRFWIQAVRPESSQQRRKIQQPVSLVLQLIALALLLLAVAQPRIGALNNGARDHVLVLDTSSSMAAGDSRRTAMDEARESARAYLRRLPSADRVMLVRADGLAVPATTMTEDRAAVSKAIDESRPAAAALDINQALTFASEARRMNSRQPGEIVFIGAGRIREQESSAAAPDALRVIPVRHPFENVGLRRIGLRRSATDPALWDVFVSARNYGTRPVDVPVVVQFGGAQVAGRRLQLVPGRDEEFSFHLRTTVAGWLEARLLTKDALPDDDRAIVELPKQRRVSVAVYTHDAQSLRPLLGAHPYVDATFRPPSAFTPETATADVVVIDGFDPPRVPKGGIIWLRPPHSRRHVTNAPVVRWRADHELSSGLHASGLRFESADVLDTRDGDVPIAEVEQGPVIVARTRPQRMVLLGYHPGESESRFDVMTPLLFANILRWLNPDAFRAGEVQASSVGTVTVPLDADEVGGAALRVADERGQPLPFTVRGRTLRFYSGTPGTVRVTGSRGERVYSLTLPEVGETEWTIPVAAQRGMPPLWQRPLARDLWPWFAIAGALVLLVEWLLYGRARNSGAALSQAPPRVFMKRAS